MVAVPLRSPGVLLSALGAEAVAYDLATATVHHMNSQAGAILAACDGERTVSSLIDELSAGALVDHSVIATDLRSAFETFQALGLVDRRSAFNPARASTSGPLLPLPTSQMTGTYPVIDHRIAFQCAQPEVVALIDRALGGGFPGAGPTLVIEVVALAEGDVLLLSDEDQRFPSIESLIDHLPSILTGFAIRSADCVVLHSGGARSPTGQVVLLPGQSGSGKSTLTATLIANGWDYLSDEAVGVRAHSLAAVSFPKPLSVAPTGLAAAGISLSAAHSDGPGHDLLVDVRSIRPDAAAVSGEAGTIELVLLCTWDEDRDLNIERLGPRHGLEGLLLNTLNLSYCGESGLRTLCEIATRVPVQRVRHGDAASVVRNLETLLGDQQKPGFTITQIPH